MSTTPTSDMGPISISHTSLLINDQAIAHQPISVAIEADQKAFQLYMGGVFSDDTCGTELDHGVLVVGYGVDASDGEYYIVKNSWGPEWGDKVR